MRATIEKDKAEVTAPTGVSPKTSSPNLTRKFPLVLLGLVLLLTCLPVVVSDNVAAGIKAAIVSRPLGYHHKAPNKEMGIGAQQTRDFWHVNDGNCEPQAKNPCEDYLKYLDIVSENY